jgi:hypothetical protein
LHRCPFRQKPSLLHVFKKARRGILNVLVFLKPEKNMEMDVYVSNACSARANFAGDDVNLQSWADLRCILQGLSQARALFSVEFPKVIPVFAVFPGSHN